MPSDSCILHKNKGAGGSAVDCRNALQVGRFGFNSWWCNWKFSLTKSFRPHCGREVDTASNRNEYQEYLLGGKGGRYVRLTTLPPSYADFLEIWQPQSFETLWVSNRPVQGLLHLYIKIIHQNHSFLPPQLHEIWLKLCIVTIFRVQPVALLDIHFFHSDSTSLRRDAAFLKPSLPLNQRFGCWN